MVSKDFEQANTTLNGPPEQAYPPVNPLRCFKGMDSDGTPVIVSKWFPTTEELVDMNAGKPIWLFVIGRFHPPVALITDDPFAPAKADP